MFENITAMNELRKAYRAAAFRFHPDHGGTTEDMQKVNAAFEQRFEQLKKLHNAKADADETGKTVHMNETPDKYIRVINELMKLDGLEVELVGAWLWISGDTKKHKDALKTAGCRWASKKRMWYWRAEEDAAHGRSKKTMDEIREKYGSEKIIFGRPAHQLT